MENVQQKNQKQELKEELAGDQERKQEASDVSETWAEETIAEMDDFIESQGIYIRQ